MKKSEISEVLRELNIATGFRLSLHSSTSDEICAYPAKRRRFCEIVQEDAAEHRLCEQCDIAACKHAIEQNGTYSYKCRYGLTEIVSPIYNRDKLLGFLMMGQTAEGVAEKKLAEKKLCEIGVDVSEINGILSEIPTVSCDVAASYAKILSICAKYLTLSGALWGDMENIAEAAMRFITENYTSKIHIKDICSKLGCSKSTLLTSFKSEYGTTVNAALCKARLSAARKCLALNKEQGINDVALSCGFSDQSYFCKVFSREYGESPSEFKKRLAKDSFTPQKPTV